MNTYLDCIPCFFKQALHAARMNGIEPSLQRSLINKIARLIPDFDLTSSPVVMAGKVHHMIKGCINTKDPYHEIKLVSNQKAMELFPRLQQEIAAASNPLKLAIEYAIAGNIIDFGANPELDIDQELERIISQEKPGLFQFDRFYKALSQAQTILYIGDNAGEVVFDKLLVDEIHREFPNAEIYFATRGKPIINDITVEDAYFCNIDSNATVVSSGIALPGCVIEEGSADFKELFSASDCIICKGQGNFEALSENSRSIFFLFMAKCKVIADVVGAEVGSVLLLNNT